MFDIGWTELLLIAVVAIIVVGPKDLPRMLRSLGRYAGQLKRTAGEFRSQFDDAIRESELDELRSSLKDATDNPVNQIRDTMTDSMKPLEESASEIKSGVEKKAPAEKPSQGKTDSAEPDGGKKGADKRTATSKPADKTKAAAKSRTKTAAAKSGG